MNKDINKTLMALVPILRMNGENVTNIEAVHDWYKAGDREYMKEVAEITYDNGTVRYADIGCDSNLTAIYDVIAVIQQIKPKSEAIERIERGVYSLPPAQPEITPDGTLKVTVDADIASIGRILLSQTGTQEGGLYYKDAQPEGTCESCLHQELEWDEEPCDGCTVGGDTNHYKPSMGRRTDERTD